MKQHRPRISSELFERVMTDSTGVSHQDCSFEDALASKLINYEFRINELNKFISSCAELSEDEVISLNEWLKELSKSDRERSNWKGIAIITFIGWLLTLTAFWSLT